jgi:putative lipoic acid-binding regulatory protein
MTEAEHGGLLNLAYPCPWEYRVIGISEEEMMQAVSAIVQDRSCTILRSHSSATGRYCSLRVSLVVESDSHRVAVYEALRGHPAIRIVL